MIDLNPHISPITQKQIGSLTMSDKAAAEIGLILTGHGHVAPISEPVGFCPVVAATVADFLHSPYFAKSDWFRRQGVHRTVVLRIEQDPPVVPVFHLQKTKHGYSVVSCDEVPLPEAYYEERVIEEVKVEVGIPA
jgi:hypothetical protein